MTSVAPLNVVSLRVISTSLIEAGVIVPLTISGRLSSSSAVPAILTPTASLKFSTELVALVRFRICGASFTAVTLVVSAIAFDQPSVPPVASVLKSVTEVLALKALPSDRRTVRLPTAPL